MLNIIPKDPSDKYKQSVNTGSMFTSVPLWTYFITLIVFIIFIASVIVILTVGHNPDSSLADISSTPQKNTGTAIITNDV